METTTFPLLDVAEQVVLDRRHLHMHPEIRFQEHQTAAFVAERLRLLGVPAQTGLGGTGVLGTIQGGRMGKTVLLRADMDALPMDEENDVPYRSTVPGVMHACGHDGHTSILLGVAQRLRERRDRLAGTVKLCFQPAEEGSGGADAMIAAGVLESPPVDAVFGLHLAQWLPLGQVSARAGAVHAAPARIEIDVHGTGGHAAMPHLCVDTVLVAAEIVVALHRIVPREVPPLTPAVITIATNRAGTTANIIPDRAELIGTIRSFDRDLRAQLGRRVEEVAREIAAAHRARADVRILYGPPPVVNDAAMAALVQEAATAVVGPERAVVAEPTMAADDVAEMLQRAPGCYFWVGTRNEARGLVYEHHHPRFDIDESALPIGVDVLVGAVERFLAS
jgi:amidohydrolase